MTDFINVRPIWKESGLFWEVQNDYGMQETNEFDPKKEIIKITKFIYDRKLTYATGGNLLLRHKDKYYSTPSGLGRHYLYELEERDIIICDKNRVCEKGPHEVSTAVNMHISILEEFPEYDASIHTHGEFSAVFASVNKPIPNITIPISYYGGGVPIIKYNKNFDILADQIIRKMQEIRKFRKDEIFKNNKEHDGFKTIDSIPVAVLIEGEGLMIASTNLRVGVTTAEAIEEAARCVIYSSGIFNSPFFNELKFK